MKSIICRNGRSEGVLDSAALLATRLDAREISAASVLEGHLARIAALEPGLKAFITVDAEGARARAQALDAAEEAVGPLHGLPVAVKDLTDTAGLATTMGSAIHAERIPDMDDPVVARLRAAGAVIIGKANTPEFGFGAVCTNPLQGPTANPYDPVLTSGGSSGGSAVAVATGMAALAHGTDFGGSVRTPASFCGVVSIRPTVGLIGDAGRELAWTGLATAGAMARTVDDAALMLGVMAAPSALDPLSALVPTVDAPFTRIAATPDFGLAPVSDAVRARFGSAVARAEEVLGVIPSATPDCAGAPMAFRTLRTAQIARNFGPLVAQEGDRITPTVRWNVEAGLALSAQDYLAAEAGRAALWRRFTAFFAEHDVLLAPAASVLPWPNAAGEVTEMDGRPLADILDYLAVTFIVSLVGFPVVTLPAPCAAGELPFGLQLIGRPGSEAGLIAFAKRLEAAGFCWTPPPLLQNL
ncbi:amidase [Azorhizobium oxalatiphilum]|uniref:amidase n=1 Tax=Azorhizobium oxalatiphilum TaxID=980631 RepID=UPI001FCEF133|nr:amidase [Azorhizobium oxalatiphilum]